MGNNKEHLNVRAASTKLKHALVLVITLLCVNFAFTKNANACCLCCLWNTHITESLDTYTTIVDVAADGFEDLVDFLYADGSSTFWEAMVKPQLQIMTMELTAATMAFSAPLGPMFDAQSLNNTVTRMQTLSAETARNQIPAVSMCQFASLSKSLASTQVVQKETTRAVSIQNLKRTTLNKELQSSKSTNDDAKARLAQFKAKYCIGITGASEFGGLLGTICAAPAPANASAAPALGTRKRNKDINFTQTLGLPKTISTALYPGPYGPTESLSQLEDIMALSKNLYGSASMSPATKDNLTPKSSETAHFNVLKRRALQAKRNVAQHSFANYVGLKAATDRADGSELSIKPHVENLLSALGVDNSANNQYTDYFAKAGNGLTDSSPSYWTQMEVLTKTLYQDPRFYANLYDNPANVKRQQAAMRAIELMQERDIHETTLRTETLLSLWLDSELDTHGQNIVQDWANMKAAKE
jgi:hypothetical protein|tara:strand:+ start:64488 stop:65900 length:1413 start_codon:yes stop_codon:yes gene_type:complete